MDRSCDSKETVTKLLVGGNHRYHNPDPLYRLIGLLQSHFGNGTEIGYGIGGIGDIVAKQVGRG